MKKRTLKIGAAAVCAALLAGGAVWFLLRPSEELQLRRRYAELEALLSCPASAGPVTRAGKARQARLFLAEPCRAEIPPYCTAVLSRDESSKLLLRAASSIGECQVRFCDLEFPSVRDGRAEVRCNVQVRGQGPGGAIHEVRELFCVLRKAGGKWYFAEVRTEEVIQK